MIKDQCSAYECVQALMNQLHYTCQAHRNWHRCNPGNWQLKGFQSKHDTRTTEWQVSTFLLSLLYLFAFKEHGIQYYCRGRCSDQYKDSYTQIQIPKHHLGNNKYTKVIILLLQSSKNSAVSQFFYPARCPFICVVDFALILKYRDWSRKCGQKSLWL